MSTAAINLGAAVTLPESCSVVFDISLPSADVDAPASDMGRESTRSNTHARCDTLPCELELVSAAKDGDHQAFVELCRRHSPSVKRRIRHIVRNREDAEDVFQDTLFRAFRSLVGFREQSSFRTWILTIATNTSLMLLRKQRNHRETGFGLVTQEGKDVEILPLRDPMPNPEQVYATRQAHRRLSQAVKMLPPHFRLLVEHYHRDEITLRDAANAIGITVAAAKSRMLRARNMLRRSLKTS